MSETARSQVLHASCVAVNDKALLILGKSGAGKSGLALDLMAFGARLVADDQTMLWAEAGRLMARAPAATAGLIEARFCGLLRVPFLPEAEVTLALDLDKTETDRLSPQRQITLAGLSCPLAYCAPTAHLASSILCWMTHGRAV